MSILNVTTVGLMRYLKFLPMILMSACHGSPAYASFVVYML